MTRRRTRLLVIIGPAVVLVAGVIALIAPGGLQSYTGAKAGAPAWTAPCWQAAPRSDRRLLDRCSRLTGRVLWVRRQGFGAGSKAELILGSGFGVTLAKMAPYTDRHVPGIGQYVTIVGPVVQSRAGLREIQFFAQE